MHARKQIRDAVVAQLTGLATTGANVVLGRSESLPQSMLPALVLRFGPESAQPEFETIHNNRIGRTLAVTIEAHVVGGSAASGLDTLDQIAMEVEVAIETDPTFGGLVRVSELEQTEVMYDSDGNREHKAAILTYRLTYATVRTNPSVTA